MWLNIGYALPAPMSGSGIYRIGMYGAAFCIFAVIPICFYWRHLKLSLVHRCIAFAIFILATACMLPGCAESRTKTAQGIPIVGIQMEFPPENVIPKMLDKALAKNTNAEIFVLSEYTLGGPVPNALKNWCRDHSKFLVVGGMDHADTNNFYDTAFVVGTNGDIVFKQGKCVPIQFFHDGLPAPNQKLWDSPWGKIGFCVCYDLSYSRVTDELVRQGAQMLIVPTMDIEFWSRHEHELHTRVAPVRAAEYNIPIFRLASSGISQAVAANGNVVAQAPMPGNGDFLVANLGTSSHAALPIDRYLAPACTAITAFITLVSLMGAWRKEPSRP